MQQLTPFEYILIDIANCYGLDKYSWNDRIAWVKDNEANLEELAIDADDPYLYLKAIRAKYDAEMGIATGYMIGLDATQSGLQIMACMSGCRTTAKNTNLINTGEREDFYIKVTDTMNILSLGGYTREDIKPPVMTVFYGSIAEPIKVFGEDTPELAAFYATLEQECPGPMEMMEDIKKCWNSNALVHSWVLPDGHTAYVPVKVSVSKKIEVAELNKATFTYVTEINEPSDYNIPLIANVVHSLDAYVVREMVRMAHAQGFEMVTIHDAYFASPNHIQKVRENYVVILADIASKDILGDIMGQLLGEPVKYTKLSNNLAKEILQSEYALS
jgi:hypothetical protein